MRIIPHIGLFPLDHAAFHHGIALFNRGEFYEAHEVLEDVWRAAPTEEKLFLQGLIQVAVALVHHSRGNLAGAQSLLARGERNLEAYPPSYAGISLPPLRHTLALWRNALDSGASAPTAPVRIHLL
jgi:predicted metal-dependent hydrolase